MLTAALFEQARTGVQGPKPAHSASRVHSSGTPGCTSGTKPIDALTPVDSTARANVENAARRASHLVTPFVVLSSIEPEVSTTKMRSKGTRSGRMVCEAQAFGNGSMTVRRGVSKRGKDGSPRASTRDERPGSLSSSPAQAHATKAKKIASSFAALATNPNLFDRTSDNH